MLRYCTAGKHGDHRFSHGSWRTIPLRQQMMKLALPVTGIEAIEAMHVRFWVDYSVPAALRLLSFSSSQLGSFPLPLLVAPAMVLGMYRGASKKKRDVFIFQKFPEFTLTCPRYPKLNIHKSTSWFVSLRFATFSPHRSQRRNRDTTAKTRCFWIQDLQASSLCATCWRLAWQLDVPVCLPSGN